MPEPATSAPSETAARRAMLFALLVVASYAIGFGIIAPVLPRLVMTLGQVSLAEATSIGGGLVAAYGAGQFLCSPLMGALGDRFGRRPVILVALAGFALDYGVMAFAPSIGWLFAGRLIAGALGGVFAPAQAIIADVTAPADRARRFGLVGAAFGSGFVIGPAIGGLVATIDLRAPFYVAAGLAGVAFLVGLALFRETLPVDRRQPFRWKTANPIGAWTLVRDAPGLGRVAAACGLWLLAGNIYPALWSYFATERYGWGPRDIGLSLAVVGVSMVLFQALAIGPVTRAVGPRGAIRIAILGACAVFVAYSFSAAPVVAFILCAVVGVQGMAQPSFNALLSAGIGPAEQGRVLALSSSLAALAIVVAPMVYNPLFHWLVGPGAPAYAPAAPFLLAAVIAVASLAILERGSGRSGGVQMPPGTVS